MAVPKRKLSKQRTRRRKAQWLKRGNMVTLSECSHCHEKKIAHVICPNCGYYNGKEIIKQKVKKKKDN